MSQTRVKSSDVLAKYFLSNFNSLTDELSTKSLAVMAALLYVGMKCVVARSRKPETQNFSITLPPAPVQ